MSIKVQPVNGIVIRSEVVVFPSRNGRKIVGYLDTSSEQSDSPFVVMAPKYGQSKKNNLQLSYYFAVNGFRVLRFDQTNHIGESEGDIVDYTLPSGVDDILAAIDFLEVQYQVRSVVLQANSMSGRCAIRAASLDDRIERLVCLVPIINFRSTITAICQKDIVNAYMDGVVQGIGDILGHDVNIDQFLRTAVDSDMQDLQGTLDDVSNAKCDFFLFPAKRDAWVELSEVDALAAKSKRVNLLPVDGAMHELMENPKVAIEAISQAVYVSRYGRFAEPSELDVIRTPDRRQVFSQNKVERSRLRAVAPLRESEGDFWAKYLDKYKMLEAVGAYQDYLSLIGLCLGNTEPGLVYMDCGCGNGMFGAWCLRDLALQDRHELDLPTTYFGLDLTGKGLSEACQRHSSISHESKEQRRDGLNMMYYRFDLDELSEGGEDPVRLPFEDASIDRICCSLLISYLKQPCALLSELHRILKPGGKMVVSSMKPYCDLSLIYKGFISEVDSEAALDSARDLLSAAGAIQMKEDEGHYVFYSEDELIDLANQAGFSKAQFFRSFGDQTNLVSVTK